MGGRVHLGLDSAVIGAVYVCLPGRKYCNERLTLFSYWHKFSKK